MVSTITREDAIRILGLQNQQPVTLSSRSDGSFIFRFNRSRDLTQTEDTMIARFIGGARAASYIFTVAGANVETVAGAEIIVIRFTLERKVR